MGLVLLLMAAGLPPPVVVLMWLNGRTSRFELLSTSVDVVDYVVVALSCC